MATSFSKLTKIFMLLIASLFVVSCASKSKTAEVDPNAIPAWVYNASVNGKIGGVGFSGYHIKGVNAQRELATRRALEDIARQKGVTIHAETEIFSKSTSSQGSSSSSSNIVSFSNQTGTHTIKAKVLEIWVHPRTRDMYVHMVEE